MSDQHLNYQLPPQEILDLVDVPRAPFVQMDRKARYMLFIYRPHYRSIHQLCQQEMRLAGLRVNPDTNIGSRQLFYNNIDVKFLDTNEIKNVKGLPQEAQLSNFVWSICQTKLAFTNTTASGTALWYLDIVTAQAHQLTKAIVNANLGQPAVWTKDSQQLLVKTMPAAPLQLIAADRAVPKGPVIAVSDGQETQNRTYQDLLKNKNDAHNFEALTQADLLLVHLSGRTEQWLDASAMYSAVVFSPDGQYVRVSSIKRPFSYKVPYQRFPQHTAVYTRQGKLVKVVNEVPLSEHIPKGFMSVRLGRRQMQWRSDKAATLVWVEALDKGDAQQEAAFRDQLFQWLAPFEQAPQSLFKMQQRFLKVQWGNDQNAIVQDYWWNNRNTKSYLFNPSDPQAPQQLLFDRNYQDRYADPGEFVQCKNEWGSYVLDIQDNTVLLVGEGHSDLGQFPFVDQLDLTDESKKRLYQSTNKQQLEKIFFPSNRQQGDFVVRIESAVDYPNYFIRNIHQPQSLTQLTHFENPFESIQSVHKETIRYQRADGLELSAQLYLPVGYDTSKKEKMPMILWAYPREYKDNNSAGQVQANPNEFTYPFYGSAIYWVTRGYVVLDDTSFPIVGEGQAHPNDTFLQQLIDNAKAAIDAVDQLGYIDRNRVAVGGHSYGAFMTANLLTHTSLFAAGIARSGAYNRSLTPFGFQSEERNYWEATEVYNEMSPFMQAHKMKTPLLLIHGADDNNSGTYPLQSERYFDALKALGAPARLVLLPKESHGYTAKESVLHLLWEQDTWLEKYVKHRDKLQQEEALSTALK